MWDRDTIRPLIFRAILGHGAMAAQRTLDPLILVRVQVPRLSLKSEKVSYSPILDTFTFLICEHPPLLWGAVLVIFKNPC